MNRENSSREQQRLTLQQALDLAGQHHTSGDLPKAEGIYQQILQGNPNQPIALHLLGVIFHQVGENDRAVDLIKKALSLKCDYAEAHSNLGNVFKELGQLDEAITEYQNALAIKPDYAEVHNNVGVVLQERGQLDEAVESYHKTLAIKPDYGDAHSNLAIVLNSLGRRQEALDHYSKRLKIERDDNPSNPEHKSFRFITKAEINHDIEQFQYLASQEHETERFLTFAKTYEALERKIDWPSDDTIAVPLSNDHRKLLGITYNRPVHLLEAPEVTGSTLSNDLDVDKITADYFAHDSGLTYFDGLLCPKSLASLRRFLLGSTIWFDFTYRGGYLGAMLKDGLACPLLFQIADDLRQTFPAIFKDHQLAQLWAYKYDSRLTGIEVHADFAAINVNFWVTPDTANLNHASGGMVVYDAEAPLDWNFKLYNKNHKRIREYLTDCDSGKTVIPYSGNRIVLFNSSLFHETDTIEFKQGYENRRINVTLLFGNRCI